MTRVFYGWYVVVCGFLLSAWGTGFGLYGVGVYLVSLQGAHGWSASVISGAVTAYYLLAALLIALLGRAMKRFGPVTIALTGVTAMAVAVTTLTTITQPWQLYPPFILMAVGWAGMTGAIVNLLLAPWFEARRGLALSLALTGASVGGMVIAPGVLWLVHRLGYQSGLRVAVLIMVGMVMPVIAVVLRRSPEQLGLAPDGGGPSPSRRGRTGSSPAPARIASSPLRTLAYWTISVPFAAGFAAQIGFITHQLAFFSPIVGPAAAGVCVSLTGLAALLGRFALGAVVDRTDARLAAALNFLTQGAGLALLVVARPSAEVLYAGSVLFGLGVGNMLSLPGLLVQREFSRERFGDVVSFVLATNQVSFAVAPVVVGILRDATAAYTAALIMCAALDAAAAGVVLAGRRR